MLDDVHGAHGQAGTVDQAGDVTIERDVGEAELGGLDLLVVFLGEVTQGYDLGVAIEGVGVEGYLGVERQYLVVGSGNERVNFHHGGVGFPEERVEPADELGGVLGFGGVEAELEDQLAHLEIG